MTLEHIGIWTNNPEELKGFYVDYFNGISNTKYVNKEKHFESYFISFGSGARIEIMRKPGIRDNTGNPGPMQHIGLAHIAFSLDTREEVDNKALQLQKKGIKILEGPRVTGDGYYEFVTLDPDGNRIEVTTKYSRN